MSNFKTRVVHFKNDKYKVEYYNGKWHELCFWFDQGITANTECWSLDMWKIDKAENIAQSLQSIEDVKKYYEPMEKEQNEFLKKKKEYYEKATPYNSMEFSNGKKIQPKKWWQFLI